MTNTTYIPTPGSTIAVHNSGRGEPVVFLHSSASNAGQWRNVIDRMDHAFHCQAVDLPGYGASTPWAGQGRRTLAADAEIVARIARDLDRPVHLVGHSFGGAVALAATLEHTHTVASLTVIEPVSFHLLGNAGDENHDAVTQLRDTVFEGLCSGDRNRAMGCFIDYWNGTGTWASLSHDRQERFTKHLDRIVLEFTAAFEAPYTRSDYCSIQVPTTVISGVLSPRPARHLCSTFAEALPQAWLHMVTGAGHMLPITHPHETVALLRRHLTTLSASRQQASERSQAA